MTTLKTARINRAVAFTLTCPDCGPEAEVEGPHGSITGTYEDEFNGRDTAYCISCGSELSMPKIPKRVRTQEGA